MRRSDGHRHRARILRELCAVRSPGYRLGYSPAMAGERRPKPRGWSLAEQEKAQRRAIALADKMSVGPSAPLIRRHRPVQHPKSGRAAIRKGGAAPTRVVRPEHDPSVAVYLEGPYAQFLNHDPPVAVQFGLAPNGRLICTGLLVGWLAVPPSKRVEVTARAVHEIRLGEILANKGTSGESPVPGWLLQTVPMVRPPHPGRAGYPDEHFENVARLYKRALVVAPRAPMKWLSEQLHASSATADRWRKGAEDRGFLPERNKVRRGPTRTRRQPKRKGSR